MASFERGELVPLGGGDAIPLLRPVLTVGRRESCDVCMRFPNISGLHCELSFRDGFWYVRDLNSTNGVKVNGTRVQEKSLRPGDELTVGKRKYTIQYILTGNKRAADEDAKEVFSQSLLAKAGLEKPRPAAPRGRAPLDPAAYLNRNTIDDEDEDDDEDD